MTSNEDELGPSRACGPYVLIRRIAIGGMAEIFEARRADDDAHTPAFVVKLLLPQFANDPDVISMFDHEASVGRALSHPNLVSIVDFGVERGRQYLVMERVEGLSVADLVDALRRSGTTLPTPHAFAIVERVLSALAYVHEARDANGEPLGIIHRDVTPQNVLVSRTGEVRLGDFGIARSAMRAARTSTGVIKGKLRYLAPEQVTGSAVDARADLYAAGVLLWELLANEPYLRGETEIDLLRAAEAPMFRNVSAACGLDRRIDAILETALARFPEERYPSAREFLRVIESLQRELDRVSPSESLGDLVERAMHERPMALASEAPFPDAPSSRPMHTVAARPRQLGRDRRRTRVTVAGVVVAAIVALLGGWIAARELASRGQSEDAGTGMVRRSADASIVRGEVVRSTVVATTVDAGLAITATPVRRVEGSERPRRLPRTMDAGISLVRDARDRTAVASTPDRAWIEIEANERHMRRELLRRGILLTDLGDSGRSVLSELDAALSRHDLDAARRALDRLDAYIGDIRIDAAFVKRKLERVNARVSSAKTSAEHRARIEAMSTRALEEFMSGRHESANRALNEILDATDHGE